MRDSIDLANDLVQLEMENLIANRTMFQGESATHCIDCDYPIPLKRRQLIKGCQRCVDCQQICEETR